MSKFKFDGVRAEKDEAARIDKDGKAEAGVVFYACDSAGKKLHRLFAILSRGVLFMYKNVDPSLGLKLDKKGRIVVEGVNDKD